MTQRRLSLSERDAAHVYEWLLMYWQEERRNHVPPMNRFGNCVQCELIGARLEKFIGKKEVRRTARLVKERPAKRWQQFAKQALHRLDSEKPH